MKLELKHLAPYLPYGLKGKYKLSDVINLSKGQKDEIREVTLTEDNIKFFRLYCNPILRPLSDLTKEIEHNGEKFIPSEVLLRIYREEWVVDKIQINNEYWFSLDFYCGIDIIPTPLWVYEKLFEWHFDVFDLLSKGLAIDINTLKDE